MRSINKVIIIGNLTRDPEMRQTPSGQSVTTFGVATNRTWVTKSSDKKSEAEYHEVVAWGNLAEICSKYLKKSKLVYIEGYLKTRSWDTPEGIRRFKTEIVVQDMIMLDKKGNNSDDDYVPMDDYAPNDEDDDYVSQDDNNDQSQSSNNEESTPETTASPAAPAQPETPQAASNEPTATESSEPKIGIDDDLGL